MAKQVQTPEQGLPKKKAKPEPSLRKDLTDLLIGMAVTAAFITALLFGIGALLR